MSDETPPEPTPADELPKSPPEEKAPEAPEMVSIEADELERLWAHSVRYRKLTGYHGKRPLNAADLDRRLNAQADSFPDRWEGEGPGMHVASGGCHPEYGLDAIYYRGTLGLICRVCKRMRSRIKVAAGPVVPDNDDSE